MLPSAPIVAYPALTCAILLTVSNVFMTFAWYGHLKHLQAKPWWIAAFVPFVIFYMGEPLKLDYFWAGLCLMGAAYFIFR